MMMMDLWVDDCKACPDGCAVARTYDDALRMLRTYPCHTLFLDHDLGEDRTGYDLLREIAAEGILPKYVQCISWNPVGRARIEALAHDLGIAAAEQAEGVTSTETDCE